jgi:hypothetical protein
LSSSSGVTAAFNSGRLLERLLETMVEESPAASIASCAKRRIPGRNTVAMALLDKRPKHDLRDVEEDIRGAANEADF